ncbi:malonyl CoA-acyl carrier protein transacylase [Clostridia bacterium]|nr:malonyl CoA-acyl carrier protein transacylase [Clostridia bacterium]
MSGVALLFAGQGAQYAGMGKDLYDNSPAARRVFDMAEDIKKGTLELCFNGPEEELSRTINTQPCLFAVDLACARAFADGFSGEIGALAGFSLGELAALAFSGVLSDIDAFTAVTKRAEFMDEAANANKGVMAAVLKLSAQEVIDASSRFEDVYPVNFNSPAQTVVAARDLTEFEKKVKELGGRLVRLNVSGAFHSPFMDSAAVKFADYLKNVTFSTPKIPIYSNVTGKPYENDFKGLLAEQIKSPVKWTDTIKNITESGIDAFAEMGAGKTLSGLVSKIGGASRIVNVSDAETLNNALLILKE